MIPLKYGSSEVTAQKIESEFCESLERALNYASNDTREEYISNLYESFRTSDLETYRESIRTWLRDNRPPVETIFGFVEPYRDPHGVRAEFEGLAAVVDRAKTEKLVALGKEASKFVKLLPWCGLTDYNDGKGPFKKEVFEESDFTSIHTVAYYSSIIFPSINLPNYNDIRQTVGSKSVMIANSLMQEVPSTNADCIPEAEKEIYLKHKRHTFYLWVVFHELLGHGTGNSLMEESPGKFNFDHDHPPMNPLTQKPIHTWYKPGETWTGVFGDLATTVDECRAECVGAYLVSDKELLSMFDYGTDTEVKAEDLEYNMYQQLRRRGLERSQELQSRRREMGPSA